MIVDRRFRGAYCLHHQGSSIILQGSVTQKTTLKMIVNNPGYQTNHRIGVWVLDTVPNRWTKAGCVRKKGTEKNLWPSTGQESAEAGIRSSCVQILIWRTKVNSSHRNRKTRWGWAWEKTTCLTKSRESAWGRGIIAPTHSWPRHNMGVSGQRHAPAAL
jgi:hypothetical protein